MRQHEVPAPAASETPQGKRPWVLENPSRGTMFEVSDFEIPDLAIPEGRVGVQKEIRFKIKNSAIPNLEGILEITRYNPERQGSLLAAIELRGVNKKENVFSFDDGLFKKSSRPGQPGSEDARPHTYWSSSHRSVERAHTGKGLAEFFLSFREEIARKLSEKYPELKAEWMEVTTDIAAIANLIVDQGWLKDHGLDAYSKKHGLNLGYVPAPDDKLRVERLLHSGTTRLGEVDRRGEPPVTFIKRL